MFIIGRISRTIQIVGNYQHCRDCKCKQKHVTSCPLFVLSHCDRQIDRSTVEREVDLTESFLNVDMDTVLYALPSV